MFRLFLETLAGAKLDRIDASDVWSRGAKIKCGANSQDILVELIQSRWKWMFTIRTSLLTCIQEQETYLLEVSHTLPASSVCMCRFNMAYGHRVRFLHARCHNLWRLLCKLAGRQILACKIMLHSLLM
jgi:hypothetical protein